MRTKRILSLVLAIAMLASLTISASAAASEVIFYEDFATSDGEAGTWLSENVWSFGTGSHSLQLALESYYDQEKANGKSFMTQSTNGGNPGSNRSAMITNSLGSPAFASFGGTGGASSQGHALYIMPTKGFDLVKNAGKALVFSAEVQFDMPTPTRAWSTASAALTAYFTDAAATGSTYTTMDSDAPISISANSIDADTNAEDDVHDYTVPTVSLTMLHHKATNSGVRTYSNTSADYPLTKGTAHRLAMSYHYDSTQTYPIIKSFAWDGDYVGKSTGRNDNSLAATTPVVRAFNFSNTFNASMSYANMKIYAIDTAAGAFNVSNATTETVPVSTTTIPVKFSQPVAPENYTANAVTVTENGTALTYGEDFNVSGLTQVVGAVGGETYSTASVTFTELKEDSTYVITFPEAITNEMGTTLKGYNTITFNTPAPEIAIESFNIVKGWGTASEATATAFAADGTLQGAALALKNNTTAAKNVAVIYAVYSTGGQLTDVVYANDTVAGSTTAEIGAGMNLSAEGTVKAFVWDGMSSLKPQTGVTVKTIAAPVAE